MLLPFLGLSWELVITYGPPALSTPSYAPIFLAYCPYAFLRVSPPTLLGVGSSLLQLPKSPAQEPQDISKGAPHVM